MTNPQLQQLRQAAEKATPGPWRVEVDPYGQTDKDGNPRVWGVYGPESTVDYGDGCERSEPRIIETDCGVYEPEWNDAAYISIANPTTVLALLDQLAAVTAARDEACGYAEEYLHARNTVVTPERESKIDQLRKVGQP